ncbi:NAD(P)-dependent oxidoreductase [Vibrio coralliilyticus]|uniref:NAD(P)-dependent oxidoreductase n=1 Tax=Vibrio coralliilyticus TaxID=190893 RepID=UPI0015616333|nr:NAD(P)-dependent oxidoreductase [Vibrio coralliilyticus]NRF27510.1 NAD(P)-dependent oxidoreductase [Vibrio coralliilyticus]NRF78405.1 NAD(P)-dependent oxidoreductase [Vibrio coralliilyticus]
MKSVAVLGLGAMGSRVAQQFINAGYETHVWNRSSQPVLALENAGAISHPTPKSAAAHASVVISMVRDDQASKDVWLSEQTGALYGLQPSAVAIESSTLSSQWVKALAQEISAKCEFVEAPVVGSRPQAEAGQLIYLLGGSEQAIERAESVLQVSGAKHIRCGEPGMGAVAKLSVNTFFAVQTSALAEIFSNMKANGISHHDAAELFAQLPTTSPVAAGIARLIAADKFEPLFPIDLVLKDLSYQTAQSDSPLLETTKQIFAQAVEQGLAQENIHAVAKLYR